MISGMILLKGLIAALIVIRPYEPPRDMGRSPGIQFRT
jgi:hypothetical protein